MTRTTSTRDSAELGRESRDADVTGWVGWIAFAGSMMLLVGSFHVIQGLIALFSADYYAVGPNGLAIRVDFSAWGWAHLVGGVLVVLAGAGVFAGQTWARVVGVILALLSAVLNFAFIAAYPFWSVIVIAVDVFIVYALCVHGRSMKRL